MSNVSGYYWMFGDAGTKIGLLDKDHCRQGAILTSNPGRHACGQTVCRFGQKQVFCYAKLNSSKLTLNFLYPFENKHSFF